MVGFLSAITIAATLFLSINAAESSMDADVCLLSDCGGPASKAASASALMQQVQQLNQEQMTKVVASETASEAAAAPNEGGHAADHKPLLARKPAEQTVVGASPSQRRAIVAKFQKKFGKPSSSRVTAGEATVKATVKAAAKATVEGDNSVPGLLSMLQTSSEHRGMARLAYKAAPRRAHSGLRGWTAPLDEAGYHAIAELKSDDDMDIFIKRVIDAYDCKIVNQGGFMSIVPWFSGTTAVGSFEKLQETLLYEVLSKTGNPWLVYRNTDATNGSNAELSFMGYVEVAASRKLPEMVNFSRRVCEKLGVQIVDEQGFSKMVKHFADTDKFQDYNFLEKEIAAAATASHSWAKWKDSKK